MPPKEPLDWIALNLLPGLGPITRHRALARFGDPGEIAYRIPRSALAWLGVRGPDVEKLMRARRGLARRAESELRRAGKLGARLLAPRDEEYPAALKTLPDHPLLLYVIGNIPPGVVRVAVVGSRRATLYGKRVATGLAQGLATRGIEVVSGGARGIDTCAHVGALEEGGRTLAVLGSGLLRPYPAENRGLYDRIAERGAVITEFPLDEPPKPSCFPRRNRLISGLAAAVVVVEAARRSGSISTANHALEQGREVLAVPGPVSSEQSQGCHALIQQGAKLVQNLDDILTELSPMYVGALSAENESAAKPAPRLTEDERTVLGMLDPVEAFQLDQLAERAPFGIDRLLAALFGLELAGIVDNLPGRHFRIRS